MSYCRLGFFHEPGRLVVDLIYLLIILTNSNAVLCFLELFVFTYTCNWK